MAATQCDEIANVVRLFLFDIYLVHNMSPTINISTYFVECSEISSDFDLMSAEYHHFQNNRTKFQIIQQNVLGCWCDVRTTL